MPFAPMPLFYFPPTLSIQQQTKEMESKSIFVGTQYVCMTEPIDPFSQSFNEIENRIQLVMLTVYINIHSSLWRTWRDSYTITIGDVVSFHSIPIYIVKSENEEEEKEEKIPFFRCISFVPSSLIFGTLISVRLQFHLNLSIAEEIETQR